VYFYHRYRATNPFLVLEEVGHQYAGACYFRVWYPSQSVIIPKDGDGRNLSGFVITPDLFKGDFEY
jgi:hypothetical protein